MTNKEIMQYTSVLFTQAPIRVCLDGTIIDSRTMFGILGSRCLTGSALLDCHVLKGFVIYMIRILDSLSGVWKPITGTHRVTSICNLSSII